MGKRVLSSSFTTSAYRANRRFEAYRESMGVVFDASRPSLQEDQFFARINSYLLGDMMLVECEASAQRFERTPAKIARDGMDHYLVQIFTKGQTARRNGAKDVVGNADTLIVIDTAQPWIADNNDFCNLTLVMPRRVLAGKLLTENDHQGRTIRTDQPFGRILIDFIRSLRANIEHMDVNQACQMFQPCTDLVAAAINDAAGSDVSEHESASLAHLMAMKSRIRQYIDQHLSKHDVSIDQLTQVFNISRSHLYRLFASEGGIATYIRTRRLNLAYTQVIIPPPQGRSIAEIAFAFGFSSETVFGRAFKQHFGQTPSEARNEAALRAHSSGDDAHTARDRAWETWIRTL